MDSFLGIKYAQAKRFEKPQSPTPWNDPYFAESYGKACPQSPIASIVPMGTDEDCLFINLFVPNRELSAGEYLPVMQWIHGGAYVSFSGFQLGTDILASEGDVIVITFNYRLGALGFLTTGNGDLPGNYGMFDQLKALQWTKDNIRRLVAHIIAWLFSSLVVIINIFVNEFAPQLLAAKLQGHSRE